MKTAHPVPSFYRQRTPRKAKKCGKVTKVRDEDKKVYVREGKCFVTFSPFSPSPWLQNAPQELFSLLQEFTVRNIQAVLETKAAWREVRGLVCKRNLWPPGGFEDPDD